MNILIGAFMADDKKTFTDDDLSELFTGIPNFTKRDNTHPKRDETKPGKVFEKGIDKVKEHLKQHGIEPTKQKEKPSKPSPFKAKDQMSIQESIDKELARVEKGLEKDIAAKGVYHIKPEVEVEIKHFPGRKNKQDQLRPWVMLMGDEFFEFTTEQEAKSFVETMNQVNKQKALAVLNMIDYILSHPAGPSANKFKAAVINMIVGAGQDDPRKISMDFGTVDSHTSKKLPGWQRDTKMGTIYTLTARQLAFITSMFNILRSREERKGKELGLNELKEKLENINSEELDISNLFK